jgi:hypothetical protein
MKIFLVILGCVFSAEPCPAMMMGAFGADTNRVTAAYTNLKAEQAMQRYYLLEGKIGALQRDVGRLQVGFLILAVLVGSAAAALGLLVVRDLMSRRIFDRKNGPVPARADELLVEPALSASDKLTPYQQSS